MNIQPTSGSLKRILSGERVTKPILQCLGYKKIPGTGSNDRSNSDRYRFLVSDQEVCYPFCMLATKYNDLIQNGEIDKYALIELENYLCNQLQPDKKVIVMTDLKVLVKGSEVGRIIGTPINMNSSSSLPSTGNTTSQVNGSASLGSTFNRMPTSIAPMTFGGSGSANSSTFSGHSIYPIVSLTPYQNKWTIRARVTNKTSIRTYSNSRGEGKLFSMDLVDETGEIRATAFNDQCDKFYNMIEKNKVYYVSKATLKTANKQFTSIKNDYEMMFNGETEVQPCPDAPSDIPSIKFDIIPISQIENVEKGALVDVIGVCKNAGEVQTIVSRSTNKEFKKRDLTLVDKSNTQVTLTLWGEEAENFEAAENPIVVVKSAKVTDFGGKSLTCISSSMVQLNPDIHEAHVLRGWYDREGSSTEIHSLSSKGPSGVMGGAGGNWKTLGHAKDENLGADKPDYYTTKAVIAKIRHDNCLYMACPSADCNKKVVDLNNGSYRCEKCCREYADFKWRLLLSVNIVDFSDHQWVTCFQEAAEALLGKTAQEIGQLKDENDEEFRKVFTEAMFKPFIFRLRTKLEEFKDESRLKTTVMQAIPLNYVEYGKKLIEEIKQFETLL